MVSSPARRAGSRGRSVPPNACEFHIRPAHFPAHVFGMYPVWPRRGRCRWCNLFLPPSRFSCNARHAPPAVEVPTLHLYRLRRPLASVVYPIGFHGESGRGSISSLIACTIPTNCLSCRPTRNRPAQSSQPVPSCRIAPGAPDVMMIRQGVPERTVDTSPPGRRVVVFEGVAPRS